MFTKALFRKPLLCRSPPCLLASFSPVVSVYAADKAIILDKYPC